MRINFVSSKESGSDRFLTMNFSVYLRWIGFLLKTLFNSSRSVLLFLLLILFGYCVWNGYPKWIFHPRIHLPWLTSIHHVQPLRCLPDANHSEWPRPAEESKLIEEKQLTVVVVTARPEFHRLPLSLAALVSHLDHRHVFEVMFLVPPKDVSILEQYLSKDKASTWPWPISLQSDDLLLQHAHINSYRLQMMFKLFLAQIVRTEYYLLLDSDCVAVWPIHVKYLLYRSDDREYRAIYQIEGKLAHKKWWSESEQLLQMPLESCVSESPSSSPTMGVTPSILSRTIALRTLCRLQKLYGDERFLMKMANWRLGSLIFGQMWTEYTMYYLTARCTKIFDRYHVHPSNFTGFPRLNLYGFSIWSSVDWTDTNRQRLIDIVLRGLGAHQRGEGNNQTNTMESLFTVLQGRHNVNPLLYHQTLYPLYIRHLQDKQDNRTKKLVKLLEQMSKDLVVS